MTLAVSGKPVLVISNGHGEDSIAAEIVRRLPGGLDVAAYPTLGAGKAYEGLCRLVGPRRFLPSEGQRREGSFWRDARAGFGISAALSFMAGSRGQWSRILVVGDLIGVLMCWLSGNRVAVYADVYRSGYANAYSWLERRLIQSTCDVVFNRDALLAEQLRADGIDARFSGNVMMDTLSYGPYDPARRRRKGLAVAVLPGSRAALADNLALQVAALREAGAGRLADVFVALVPGTDLVALAASTGLQHRAPGSGRDGDLGELVGEDLTLNLVTGSLGNVLRVADLVLGQAGTANLQALGLGKPVVSFLAPGAREQRRQRIAAMLGESREVVEPRASALADAVGRLLADPVERQRRGEIGRERIGPPGAMAAIVAELVGVREG